MAKYKTMKYYLDTEFHEYEKKPFLGKPIDTIELISIGIVAEDDRTYYAICNEFDLKAAWNNEWLRENVLKGIWEELEDNDFNDHFFTAGAFTMSNLKRLLKQKGQTKAQIATNVKEFCTYESKEDALQLKGYFKPEFYAYYADYDWVVFCWLFGRMIDLPSGFPMYCRDLQQIKDDKKAHSHDMGYPTQGNEHNALDDAKWNKRLHAFLDEV